MTRIAVIAGVMALVLAMSACSPESARPDPHGSAAAIVPQDDLRAFIVPLAADVPRDLVREQDDPRLVTWRLAGRGDEVVRLMAPTTVRPDGSTPRPAPLRYGDYLRGLTTLGARVERTDADRWTLTVPRAIDAGLGCWSSAAADCFSLAPGTTLLVAVRTVHGRPIVLVARTWRARPSTRLTAAFERVLHSLIDLE